MQEQIILKCFREIGAHLVHTGVVPHQKGSFAGVAIRYLTERYQLPATTSTQRFLEELHKRLWKTGRVRIWAEPAEVLSFALRSVGLDQKLSDHPILYH